MPSTTHADFGHDTEALDVAKAFSSGIKGKTVIITGVNTGGLGYSAAQALASQAPAHVIITGRSPDKLANSIAALKADYPDVDYRSLVVDLSSQASVRASAAELLAMDDVPVVDLVINSAGVMGVQQRTFTKDGVEMHFATNHIGHWLFCCLIVPKLAAAAKANPVKGATRIVNISSGSPSVSSMRFSDMKYETINKDLPEAERINVGMFKAWGYDDAQDRAYVPLDGYNRSKVSNVLFGIGANKRLLESHGIFTTAVHPGVIPTELGRNFPTDTLDKIAELNQNGYFKYKTLGAGSSTGLVAALDPKLAENVGETVNDTENWGAFLMDCQICGGVKKEAVSSVDAERLWKMSEEIVGEKFAW